MSEFVTKTDYVARALRERIISGQLVSGERILQQNIADQLGVSATPVREAIRQLESEGYLDSSPHIGVRVAAVDLEGLDEAYSIRSTLEGQLARLAATKIDADSVQRLRKLCDAFANAIADGAVEDIREYNYQFHRLIWEVAERPVTFDIVDRLWARFPLDTLDYLPERGEKSAREHVALLDALEAHDSNAAESALRQHVESGHGDFASQRSLSRDST